MADLIEKIQTPQGALKYCFITGQGRLKPRSKTDYSYSAAVVLDKKTGKALYKTICEFFVANRPPKCELEEPENVIFTKLDNGDMMFQFRTNTTFLDKDKNEVKNIIKVVNAKNQERALPEGVGIGEGSIGSILGAMKVYEGDTVKGVVGAGCSMFLNAVRIAKFVPYKGGATFEDEADGDFDNYDAYADNMAADEADAEKEPVVKEKKKKKDKKKKDKTSSISIDENDDIPY